MLKNFISFSSKKKSIFIKYYSKFAKPTSGELLIDVGSLKCHVEIVGKGKEPILLIPGGIGTPKTDFFSQLDHLDRNKYTIIGWSPPGNGLSTPYDVNPRTDTMNRNAEVAAKLIRKLGFDKVNVMGWCSGGISAIAMGAKYPEVVKKLVLISAWVKCSLEDLKTLRAFEDISTWDPLFLDPLVSIYGRDRLQRVTTDWINMFDEFYYKKNGEMAVEECKLVKCSTLVIHSRDDNFISYGRHAHLITSLIQNARLATLSEGEHAPHLRIVEQFNATVDNFIFNKET